MLYRRAILIYNPRAGRIARGGQARLEQASALLAEIGHGFELRPTTGPRTATAMAREAVRGGADLVIAAGGDGTINEVMEGLVGSAVPLGILPAGTANVLGAETGLGSGMLRAARRLGELAPCRIPVGRIATAEDTRHFLLMAGAGLDAHVVYNVDAALKSRTGKLAYWLSGFRLIGRDLPEFRVEAGGAAYHCSFALVSRVRNYGGDLQIACRAHLLDDCFEVVLFEGRSSYVYLKYLAGVAARRLAGMKGVTLLRTDRVDLSAPSDTRIYTQVDGEYVGRLPARIELVRDAVTLLLPKEYVEERRRAA